jgi:hypothetical protein
MKRGGAHSSIRFVHVFLVLLAVALAGLLSDGRLEGAYIFQNSGYSYGGYGGYGGGFFGVFSFIDFYSQYGHLIDAFLFLVIFLSVGKTVLQDHFKKGGQSLYIGVGIALALGLLLWEETTGFLILQELGPYAGLLLALVILVMVYRFMVQAGTGGAFAAAILGLVLYFFLLKGGDVNNTWFGKILYQMNVSQEFFQYIMGFIDTAALLLSFYLLYRIGAFFFNMRKHRPPVTSQ